MFGVIYLPVGILLYAHHLPLKMLVTVALWQYSLNTTTIGLVSMILLCMIGVNN